MVSRPDHIQYDYTPLVTYDILNNVRLSLRMSQGATTGHATGAACGACYRRYAILGGNMGLNPLCAAPEAQDGVSNAKAR